MVDSPYVGPRPFTEQERNRFFGREREAQELLSLVTSERLVLFYGASGAGKSSLINARLVPGLREEGFDVLPIGRVSGELPTGVTKVDNFFIFNLILSLDQHQHEAASFTQTTLGDYLQQHQTQTDDKVPATGRVLIIEQFEEILTTHPEYWQKREDFFRQLNQAMVDDPLLRVVLSLRGDYVADLDPYAHLLVGEMQARFYLQRMEYEAALEALKRPAELAGRPFGPGVAETLVDNLRQIQVQGTDETQPGQFIEPVQLQMVGYELWENLRDLPTGVITSQDLEEFGDVDAALAQFYEDAIANAVHQTGISEMALRNWFEHQLITEAGTRGMVHRGERDTAGMPNQVVDLLVSQFLLRPEIRAGRTWYELAHDRWLEPILAANRAWSDRTGSPDIEQPTEPTLAAPPDLGRYGEPDGPRQRFEEVMAGISFGGGDAPARTITALVTDQEGNPRLLLPGGMLSEGAEVIQPSRQYGGNDQDRVGTVEKVSEKTDIAAVARLEGDRTFLSLLPNRQPVKDVKKPELGLNVCKFGAASGYTEATITQTGQFYDISKEITLSDVFFIEARGFSEPEDIGALVVEIDTNQTVGVIVESNDSGTFCLPIQPVLDSLGVEPIQDAVHYVRQHQATDEITAHGDLATGKDRLGFTHYVDAFARLIEDTDPPLTIGIYGAWGTGKTFLMKKIVKRLNPGFEFEEDRKLNIWQKIFCLSKTPMPIVWFGAWNYNACDKLWAGLVKHIFLRIENSGLGRWYVQLSINLRRNLERQWRDLRPKLLPYALIAIVVGALMIRFVLNNQDAWAKAVSGSAAFLLLVSLVRQLASVFSTSASQRIVDLFATTDYQEEIGFMGRIKQDLESFANSLPKGMKVVVFIDDLDRCDPEKAVEVLEAIKLLLDFDRFIVFLALDARVITQAVEEHYGKVLTEAEITGYEYLDKIVQIPFSIPEPPHDELRKYLGSLVDMSDDEILSMMSVPAPEEKVADEFVKAPVKPETQEIDKEVQEVEVAERPSEDEGPAAELEEEIRIESEDMPSEPTPLPRPTEKPFDIRKVSFTPAEQKAFLDFSSHLDPNPRRVKRLVNVYRLVRALIGNWRQGQEQGSTSAPSGVPEDPHQVLAWLILCEQWPYAAHVMLEILNCTLKQAESNPAKRRELLGISVEELWQAAKKQIDKEKDETLKKLDLTYDRLQSFVEQHLAKLTLGDVQQLQPFTVNFNPALSAEVRLTLSSGERGPVQPVEAGTPTG